MARFCLWCSSNEISCRLVTENGDEVMTIETVYF
jgi:hypothetical protein